MLVFICNVRKDSLSISRVFYFLFCSCLFGLLERSQINPKGDQVLFFFSIFMFKFWRRFYLWRIITVLQVRKWRWLNSSFELVGKGRDDGFVRIFLGVFPLLMFFGSCCFFFPQFWQCSCPTRKGGFIARLFYVHCRFQMKA